MKSITHTHIKEAINRFLTSQYDNKASPEEKKLEKAIQDNNTQAIEQINAKLQQLKDKYKRDTWMEYASSWMSNQLSFGTHISKGVHASSKGDNIIYTPSPTTNNQSSKKDFAGHHSLPEPIIDASGNAAALPLAAFLQTTVSSDTSNKSTNTTIHTTIGELIKNQHPSLKDVFHSDSATSQQIHDIFYKLVIAHIDTPSTDEQNKQILFPTEDDYICLVPLYPTSLTHHLYTTIQDIKFSDDNMLAKKNRNKATEIQQPYTTIHDLAVLNIGGSNPQGVSQLMSKKRGKTYLLPSLPPNFTQSPQLTFSKNANSIFNAKSMAYQTRRTLDALYNIIKTNYNNVSIRDARKSILDDLLLQILQIASSIQHNRPAGWSTQYNLDYAEKLWLDPNRKHLEGEDTFKEDFEKGHWQQEIEQRFARWLQALLKNEFPKIKDDFADPEQSNWQQEMQTALKESQRLGQGAFQ
ncbi:type I-F CRISPR-associated protein Csy1 [Psychrobacter sp. I-STPA10]|uniref:type I-F CRISPR-associated protein Csy1 n=1 Tax=Psychrobacter sp. I-STPA10 TaxID=2585769 RepID=UPI001E626294|nr:type I-F CRISPR-associated protein Csy1 [Psychrobacter sp. I-STPA10]